MKITDLDRFVQTDIYSPYKNNLDEAYKKLRSPVARDLDNAKYHLMNCPEWSELVINRLAAIKYTFPKYIKHELVEYINQKIRSKK